MDEIDRREPALHDIIRSAGERALQFYRQRQPGDYSLKGRQDFLTEADGLFEHHVCEELRQRFPEDGLLGLIIPGKSPALKRPFARGDVCMSRAEGGLPDVSSLTRDDKGLLGDSRPNPNRNLSPLPNIHTRPLQPR